MDPQQLVRSAQRRAWVASLLLSFHAAVTASIQHPFVGATIDEGIQGGSILFIAGFGLLLAGFVATIVAFILWMRRVHAALRALRPNVALQHTAAECAFWWFVPFANLLKPANVVYELYRRADASDGDGPLAKERMPALFVLWWATWLGGNAADRLASSDVNMAEGVLVATLNAVAAAAAIGVIRVITRRLTERAQQPIRVAQESAHVVALQP